MATTLEEPLKRACLPVVPGLASWASLVESAHGLKVWCVKGSPPSALNPHYPELLDACVNDQNFRAIVDGRLRNRKGESTSLPDRVRDEAAKQLFAPHCVKTPGLVLFISHNDKSAASQVFSERLPATVVYHCYRCVNPLFTLLFLCSKCREGIEVANPFVPIHGQFSSIAHCTTRTDVVYLVSARIVHAIHPIHALDFRSAILARESTDSDRVLPRDVEAEPSSRR